MFDDDAAAAFYFYNGLSTEFDLICLDLKQDIKNFKAGDRSDDLIDRIKQACMRYLILLDDIQLYRDFNYLLLDEHIAILMGVEYCFNKFVLENGLGE